LEDLALKIVTSVEVKSKLGDIPSNQKYGQENMNFKDNFSMTLTSKVFGLLNFI